MINAKNDNSIKCFILIICLLIIAPQYIYVVGNVNIVNFLSLVAIVFYFIFVNKIYIRKIGFRTVSIWLFYLIYSVQCFTSVGFLKFSTYTIIFVIIPYLLYSLINTKERFLKSIDTMINLGFILGVYGLIEELTKVNILQSFIPSSVDLFHEVRYGLLRIMGTFGHPIGYGLFQVFIVSLIIYRLTNIGSRDRRKRFLRLAYVVCTLNVFFTVSRIPILSFVLLHLLLLTKISKKKAVYYFVFGVIGVFVVTVLMSTLGIKIPMLDDLVQTILLLLDGGASTNLTRTIGVGNRYDLWFWVISSMGSKWVGGYGVGSQFAYQVYEWFIKTSIENQYLNILYYNGLIALIPMIISYISILQLTGKKNEKLDFENISFNDISFLLLLIYYIAQFGVQETDMTRMYVFYLVLLLSYNNRLKL